MKNFCWDDKNLIFEALEDIKGINTMLFPYRCWAQHLDLEKYILMQRNFKILDEL